MLPVHQLGHRQIFLKSNVSNNYHRNNFQKEEATLRVPSEFKITLAQAIDISPTRIIKSNVAVAVLAKVVLQVNPFLLRVASTYLTKTDSKIFTYL